MAGNWLEWTQENLQQILPEGRCSNQILPEWEPKESCRCAKPDGRAGGAHINTYSLDAINTSEIHWAARYRKSAHKRTHGSFAYENSDYKSHTPHFAARTLHRLELALKRKITKKVTLCACTDHEKASTVHVKMYSINHVTTNLSHIRQERKILHRAQDRIVNLNPAPDIAVCLSSCDISGSFDGFNTHSTSPCIMCQEGSHYNNQYRGWTGHGGQSEIRLVDNKEQKYEKNKKKMRRIRTKEE